MGTTTTNLALYKPTVGEAGWGASVNTNFDAIDTLAASITATTQSGTTYTLALTDAGEVIEFSNGSAVALTVPTNAVVAFPVGTVILLCQYGAGQVTISGAGVTFVSPDSMLKTRVRYSTVSLRKRATNEWVLSGDLST